jgi:hypothetical protein
MLRHFADERVRVVHVVLGGVFVKALSVAEHEATCEVLGVEICLAEIQLVDDAIAYAAAADAIHGFVHVPIAEACELGLGLFSGRPLGWFLGSGLRLSGLRLRRFRTVGLGFLSTLPWWCVLMGHGFHALLANLCCFRFLLFSLSVRRTVLRESLEKDVLIYMS